MSVSRFAHFVSIMVFVCGVSNAQDSAFPPVQTGGDSIDQTTLPGIPFEVLQQAASELRLETLSDEQKKAISEFQQQSSARHREIFNVRSAIQSKETPRIRQALKIAERHAKDMAATQLLESLTESQKSAIRRKHRGAIQAAVQQRQSEASEGMQISQFESVSPMIERKDYLSAVEHLGLQDKLELTDEQFSELERLQKAANADAVSLVHDCLHIFSESNSPMAATQKPSSAYVKLQEETDAILTDEQRKIYKDFLIERQRNFTEAMASAKGPFDLQSQMMKMQPHGAVIEYRMSSVNDVHQTSLKLFNFFATRENASKLSISEDQQTKIAATLEAARVALEKEMSETARINQLASTERSSVIAKRLQQHFELSHEAINKLLTEDQWAILKKEHYRGLGLQAILNVDVQKEIGLSEEQIASSKEILSSQPAGIDTSPFNPFSQVAESTTPEDFQKRSEEFHRKSQEQGRLYQQHYKKQHAEIWKLLTPEQQDSLRTMTGLTKPEPLPAETKTGV